MTARVVVVMMTMLVELSVMSRGCCSPDLAINIPVKALKLHHAEAAPGNPRSVFDHHGRFFSMSLSFLKSVPQRKQAFNIQPRAFKLLKIMCG